MRNVNVLDVNAELWTWTRAIQLAAAIGLRGEYDTSGVRNLLLQKLARCLVRVYTERDKYEYDMIYSNWIYIFVYQREVDAFVSNGWYVPRLAWESVLCERASTSCTLTRVMRARHERRE